VLGGDDGAWCADHVASAAPTLRPHVGTLAGRIVTG
jgi:hypothetical protein